MLLLQGYGPTQAVLLTPLFFGVAHLHHAYDFVVHQGCSLHDALLMVGTFTPDPFLKSPSAEPAPTCDASQCDAS